MHKQVWLKKDTSVQLRMPSELKDDLTDIAREYNDTASGLSRFLVERFFAGRTLLLPQGI